MSYYAGDCFSDHPHLEPVEIDPYPDATLSELDAMPTLCESQADDLKIDNGVERVWLARTTMDDGEPCDDKVTIECLVGGRWVETAIYQARD